MGMGRQVSGVVRWCRRGGRQGKTDILRHRDLGLPSHTRFKSESQDIQQKQQYIKYKIIYKWVKGVKGGRQDNRDNALVSIDQIRSTVSHKSETLALHLDRAA